MELKGRLLNIVRDIRSNEFLLTFAVKVIPSWVDKFLDGSDLAISLKKWREKRSLDANAYYWVLVSKISEALGQGQSYVHNALLREYGTLEMIDGRLVPTYIKDTEEAIDIVFSDEYRHLKPTSKTVTAKNGDVLRMWYEIKGSSKYDTKEMSTLINGAVQEAEDLGIETLPPEKLERMMQDYEINHAKR